MRAWRHRLQFESCSDDGRCWWWILKTNGDHEGPGGYRVLTRVLSGLLTVVSRQFMSVRGCHKCRPLPSSAPCFISTQPALFTTPVPPCSCVIIIYILATCKDTLRSWLVISGICSRADKITNCQDNLLVAWIIYCLLPSALYLWTSTRNAQARNLWRGHPC